MGCASVMRRGCGDMPGYHRRPVPADFAAVAPTMSQVKLAKHYRCSDMKIKEWLRETGVRSGGQRGRRKTLPADLEQFAAGHCIASLAKVLGWSDCTLGKHLKRHKPAIYEALRARGNEISANVMIITPPPPQPKKQRPDDFEQRCRTMNKRQLQEHYGCSLRIVTRWIEESPSHVADWVRDNAREACMQSGALGGRARKIAHGITEKKPRFYPARRPAGQRIPLPAQTAPTSRADMAMRWLQRFGPCYPMRVHMKALDDYMILGRRMPAAAVIAEAERRGWQPDAWRQIAA